MLNYLYIYFLNTKLFYTNILSIGVNYKIISIIDILSLNLSTFNLLNISLVLVFSNIYLSINYIYLYIFYFYFLFLYLFILFFSKNYFYLQFNNYILVLLICTILTENEKEINSLDDLFYIFIFFSFFFFYSFFFYGFIFLFMYSNIFIFFFFFQLKLIILLIPVSILLDYGFFFIVYIRGCSNTSLLVYEILLDYINIIGYFTRIYIQLIRLVVIFITFYQFNELYIENFYFYYYFYKSSNILILNYSYQLIFSLLLFLLHWFYEIIHFIFIFLLQSIAFNIVILELL